MHVFTPFSSALLRFVLLYATLYAAFGVESPFMPMFLSRRGLGPEAISVVLAAGIAARLVAAPVAGRLADRLAAGRTVLASSAGGAALVALGYFYAQGFGMVLGVALIHSALLAPPAPIADALALGAAAKSTNRRSSFDYGWVRGAGAGAFILGSAVAGQAIRGIGINIVIGLHAALLIATAAVAPGLPFLPRAVRSRGRQAGADVTTLLHLKSFRRLVLVAALIQGSHAFHESFAVLRWTAAGIGPGFAGLLWSEAVLAEVFVFLLLGRPLLDRLGPGGASALAAGAGAVRWAISAETAWLPVVALTQPLHGLSFALQHLAAMRLLAHVVPPPLAATALTLYGTVGVGVATTLLTLASGVLYHQIGAAGFWVMGALCALAIPLSRGLRVS